MKSDGDYKWYYAFGPEPEGCTLAMVPVTDDLKADRDAVLAEARADDDDQADERGVTIICAAKAAARTDVFDMDEVLDAYESRNEEIWNEDGYERPRATSDQRNVLEQALNTVFAAWLDQCPDFKGKPWAFASPYKHEEYVPPKAPEVGVAETQQA